MYKNFQIGLRGKTTLVLGGVIILMLFIISSVSYFQSKSVIEQKIIELELSKLSLLQHEIEGILHGHRNNLLSLHDFPPIAAIIRARANNNIDPQSGNTLQTWRQRLITTFGAFLQNHSEYFQIRFIDASGNELVRVEKNLDGDIEIAAEDTLQNKADSLYVSETLKLQPNETYYSDVNLNREKGIIQLPHVPVLRMATPVHNVEQQITGLIVINLSAAQLFTHINSEPNGIQRNIIDQDGYFIKHQDASKTFGLERGVDFRLKDAKPALAEIVKRKDNYMALNEENEELNGFQKIFFSPLDQNRYWALTLDIPENVALSEATSALNKILFISLFSGLLSLALIVWFVSRKILTPVVDLATAAQQLQNGDLRMRVNPKSAKDEFLTLYTAINAFAENQQYATKQLNKEVDAQTKKLTAVINHVVDGIISINAAGIIESFNPAAERIFGYSAAEVSGHNIKMLMPKPYVDEHDGYLKNYRDTGEKKIIGIGREVQGKRKDGSVFPMELAVSEMNIDGQQIFSGLVRDITERKNFEKDIRNREARYRSVIDAVLEGIITIDEQGTLDSMNPASERIFGYEEKDVKGQNIKLLMPEPYHSEHDGYLHNYMTTGEAKIIGSGREVKGLRKNGEIFPMELSVSQIMVDDKRMFIGLVRDITERKKIDKMKNEFISTVSHELRTPLTSIQGALELILSGAMGTISKECTPLLHIASNNSERLIRLINDILDIEKIESGHIELHMKPVEIMNIVHDSIQANQAYGDEYGVTFQLVHQVPNCFVMADSDRLIQVLTNLLSNAAKFSNRGDTVDVGIALREGRVRVCVTDYGSGIPDEFRDRIFNKFSQADASSTKQKGGTGLGLSISKTIIEKLDGNIGYESEINKKTSFYFDLPIYQQELLTTSPAIEGQSGTILICEDDPDIANLLQLMLEKKGYSTDIAANAEQAKQKLQVNSYAAMTLDLMLPGQSGIDFFKEIRQTEGLKELPVIIISAVADEARKELSGDALFVYDWLSKPIDQKRLDVAIRQAMGNKQNKHFRILHIEDDPDIVTLIGALLQNTATVDVAIDLKMANEKLKNDYDLVILDLMLPDGSGSSLLPVMAQRNPPIPVVVFSALDKTEELKDRVDASLVKSKTSNEDLIRSIDFILQQQLKTTKD
ncbi:MAG: PAS domain S-box protein [Cycloclasticus sp.]